MNTDSLNEREEAPDRLTLIREARRSGALPWSHLSNPAQQFRMAGETLDFLLSLLDGQSKLARELALIVDVGTSDDPGTALKKVRKLQDSAATRMRDLCVAKVRAMAEAWSGASQTASDNPRSIAFYERSRAAETIATALESLTLDSVQKDQPTSSEGVEDDG